MGDGKKSEGFLEFLNNRLAKRPVDKYILKTAGPQMDVLILQNILEQYNNLVEQDVLDYPSIGMGKVEDMERRSYPWWPKGDEEDSDNRRKNYGAHHFYAII